MKSMLEIDQGDKTMHNKQPFWCRSLLCITMVTRRVILSCIEIAMMTMKGLLVSGGDNKKL